MHTNALRQLWAVVTAVALSGAPWDGGRAGAAEPSAAKQSNRWALLIGVDDYNELEKLHYAGADQQALAEQLIAAGFPKDQVYLLHDKAARNKFRPSRENIDKQLGLILNMLEPNDMVIVGFSGHGMQLNGKSYLCPSDTRLDKLADTMLPLDDVYERMSKCQAALRLLIVDACRNDMVPGGRRGAATPGMGRFANMLEPPPQGILLLSSCSPGQVSLEDEHFGHGVFMHYVLEGLQGQAADGRGVVSLTGLFDFASRQTSKYAADKFSELQKPMLKGEIDGPFEICSRIPNRSVTNSIGMRLVRIPSGKFWMGTVEPPARLSEVFHEPESVFNGEYPAHEVSITRPFELGSCEVTNGQFRIFVEATDYQTDLERDRRGGGGMDPNAAKQYERLPAGVTWRNADPRASDQHPVVLVSWNDAQAFCRWLSRKEGRTYRLPTEAEWEYACRAGTSTRYWTGDDPETLNGAANGPDAAYRAVEPNLDYATLSGNDGYVGTSPVAHFRENPFGLYDMHGNVWEWCQDGFDAHAYRYSAPRDPQGPDSADYHVIRGGCFM